MRMSFLDINEANARPLVYENEYAMSNVALLVKIVCPGVRRSCSFGP